MSVSSKEIEPPNYTQIPNVVFDYWLARLKPAAGIVLLIMCRKIFGWHKSTDEISKTQLCNQSGLSKNTIQTAIEELEEGGLVQKLQNKDEYGFKPNSYRLKIDKPLDTIYSDTPNQNLGGGGSKSDLGVGQKLTEGRSKVDHTKERPSKEKERYMSASPPLSELPFGRITSFFFEKLKEMNPKIKPTNLSQWAKEMKLLIEKDGRSEEEITKIIEYIAEQHTNPKSDFTWSQAVISPQKLRKHFATIWLEISKKKPAQEKQQKEDIQLKIQKSNIQWARLMFATVKDKLEEMNGLSFRLGENCVYLDDKERRQNIVIGYGENGFREVVEKFLKTRGVL